MDVEWVSQGVIPIPDRGVVSHIKIHDPPMNQLSLLRHLDSVLTFIVIKTQTIQAHLLLLAT